MGGVKYRFVEVRMNGLQSKYRERQRLQGGVRLGLYLYDTSVVMTLQYVRPEVSVAQRIRADRDSLMRLDNFRATVKP
jgi:hypothetical protein